MSKIILDNNIEELTQILTERYKVPSFRAGQLYKWLLAGVDICQMTDIPKDLRTKLDEDFVLNPVTISKKLTSKDGTIKFLFGLHDNNLIEGVLMNYKHGNTLCLSTQVGCKMGCVFCASGEGGFVRDLSAGEMLGQVITAGAKDISNLVLMGSGEPLDNYDNVVKFLRLVTDEKGLNMSRRNISVSTCGLPDKIKKLADEKIGVNLSLSLHATTDENRQKLMPIARTYSIAEVMKSAKYYFEVTGRRITIEYCLTKENTTMFDVKRLAELTKGLPSHINLIPLNGGTKSNIIACTKEQAQRFADRLITAKISNSIRRSLGTDIQGACGQLRAKFVGCKEGKNDLK
ncbi:MAG: 23S rRNA (adenine(2503)-C(2))-methyltransferase RlmN [Firmicutes bacterium]|nr:23S rRNA (adenine(2503)-C(2))-methyltransferase RlmN [Bacillota bacterium]